MKTNSEPEVWLLELHEVADPSPVVRPPEVRMRQLLKQALRSFGFRCGTLADGHKASIVTTPRPPTIPTASATTSATITAATN